MAESLAIKKANYVANTGFGWGGDGVVLSEELMWNLTKKLVAGTETTPGLALRQAKQQYFADHPYLGPYSEKITTQSTLYGLPMYQYTSPAYLAATAANSELEMQTSLTALGGGLQKATSAYAWPMPFPESSPEGSFYTLFGAVTGDDGEPVLPRLLLNVSRPGTALHGAVFTGGSYQAGELASGSTLTVEGVEGTGPGDKEWVDDTSSRNGVHLPVIIKN